MKYLASQIKSPHGGTIDHKFEAIDYDAAVKVVKDMSLNGDFRNNEPIDIYSVLKTKANWVYFSKGRHWHWICCLSTTKWLPIPDQEQALMESHIDTALVIGLVTGSEGGFPEIADSAAYAKLLRAWNVCQDEIRKHYALSEAQF